VRVLSGRTTVVDKNLLIPTSCIQTLPQTIIDHFILTTGAELHRTTSAWTLVGPLRGLLGISPARAAPCGALGHAGSTKFGRPRKTQAFFGAPELRPRAGVVRKAPAPAQLQTQQYAAAPSSRRHSRYLKSIYQ